MPSTKQNTQKTRTNPLKLSIVMVTLVLLTMSVFKMYPNQPIIKTSNTSITSTRNYFLVPGILSSLLFIHQTGAHPSSSN